MIGGTSAASRNLVSGNDIGIGIASLAIGGASLLTAEAGSVVQGDLIGTDATGAGNLGNSVIGVVLAGSGNVVGGTAPGQANTIAFNGQVGSVLNIGVGVVVVGLSPSSSSPISVQSTGNLISGNSIYDNHNMGIGLLDIPTSTVLPLLSTTSTADIPSVVANFLGTVNLGVVPNAQLPSGSGPNDLQNFPVLASAVTQGGVTTVRGTLQSTPDTGFDVQFFSDPAPGASGYGEGQVYLGQTTVTTGSNGLATIAFTPSAAVPVGQVIAATAIDPGNDTSEFSKAVSVTSTATTILQDRYGAALRDRQAAQHDRAHIQRGPQPVECGGCGQLFALPSEEARAFPHPEGDANPARLGGVQPGHHDGDPDSRAETQEAWRVLAHGQRHGPDRSQREPAGRQQRHARHQLHDHPGLGHQDADRCLTGRIRFGPPLSDAADGVTRGGRPDDARRRRGPTPGPRLSRAARSSRPMAQKGCEQCDLPAALPRRCSRWKGGP